MKLRVALLIALPLIFQACKKDSDPEVDNGCIERIYIDKNDHTINSADIATVNKLFADNNIDNSNYRYTRYTHDSLQTQYPPYEKIDQKHVRVNEYAKGLRYMGNEVIFNFQKDVLSYKVGSFANVSVPDTFSHLSLSRIRKMFLEDIEKNPPIPGGNYTDSCLNAEFGFYVIRGSGNNDDEVVKAWYVTGKSRSFPMAIYNDNGSRIYYHNGIVFIY